MTGGYTYLMTNKPRGMLYVGVTANLAARVIAHREGRGSSFVRKWQLRMLVYVEQHDEIEYAIEREKRLKDWHRDWKLRLIEEQNPGWYDLFEQINM